MSHADTSTARHLSNGVLGRSVIPRLLLRRLRVYGLLGIYGLLWLLRLRCALEFDVFGLVGYRAGVKGAGGGVPAALTVAVEVDGGDDQGYDK